MCSWKRKTNNKADADPAVRSFFGCVGNYSHYNPMDIQDDQVDDDWDQAALQAMAALESRMQNPHAQPQAQPAASSGAIRRTLTTPHYQPLQVQSCQPARVTMPARQGPPHNNQVSPTVNNNPRSNLRPPANARTMGPPSYPPVAPNTGRVLPTSVTQGQKPQQANNNLVSSR